MGNTLEAERDGSGEDKTEWMSKVAPFRGFTMCIAECASARRNE